MLDLLLWSNPPAGGRHRKHHKGGSAMKYSSFVKAHRGMFRKHRPHAAMRAIAALWRRSGHRRGGNPLRRHGRRNPIVVSNRRGHRRKGRRNAVVASFVRRFNPLGAVGSAPGRALATVKQAASPENLKRAGVVVGTIALAWGLPARFLPQYDDGLKGLGLTLGAGAVATVAAGFLLPALVPTMILGTGVATALKAAFMYARQYLFPSFHGLGAFLTIPRAGMGQIPAGLISGGSMGSFLETKQQVQAVGPVRSATLGGAGGENFSTFS